MLNKVHYYFFIVLVCIYINVLGGIKILLLGDSHGHSLVSAGLAFN